MEAGGAESGAVSTTEWPTAWKLAGDGEGQYTQLALYDTELVVACYCVGVLRRDGESGSGVMLAIPAAFMVMPVGGTSGSPAIILMTRFMGFRCG